MINLISIDKYLEKYNYNNIKIENENVVLYDIGNNIISKIQIPKKNMNHINIESLLEQKEINRWSVLIDGFGNKDWLCYAINKFTI